MKTFTCTCGNTLYFENSKCLSCAQEVGWCPNCGAISALMQEKKNAAAIMYRLPRTMSGLNFMPALPSAQAIRWIS